MLDRAGLYWAVLASPAGVPAVGTRVHLKSPHTRSRAQKARPESLDRDVIFVRAGKVASEDRVRAGGKNKLKIQLFMPNTIPSKQ